MRKFKKNQRVKDADDFLGEGVIVKRDKELPQYYLVLWDRKPPTRYNGRKNPCLASDETLTKIRKRK